jgi:hypothetical protein
MQESVFGRQFVNGADCSLLNLFVRLRVFASELIEEMITARAREQKCLPPKTLSMTSHLQAEQASDDNISRADRHSRPFKFRVNIYSDISTDPYIWHSYFKRKMNCRALYRLQITHHHRDEESTHLQRVDEIRPVVARNPDLICSLASVHVVLFAAPSH